MWDLRGLKMKKLNKNFATKGFATKGIAGIITVFILAVLVMSGPADAFTLGLETDNETVEQGKKIIFTASVDINAEENLPIEYLTLILDGPETVECSFDITGKIKSGVNDACHGINIKKIPKTKIDYGYGYQKEYHYGYNYGYGYTEQTLVYEITLHTQKFEVGTYQTSLNVVMDGSTYTEAGPEITILEKVKGNQAGSSEKSDEEETTSSGPGNSGASNNAGQGSSEEDEEESEEEEDDEDEEETEEETTGSEPGNSGASNNAGQSSNNNNNNKEKPEKSNNGKAKGKNK